MLRCEEGTKRRTIGRDVRCAMYFRLWSPLVHTYILTIFFNSPASTIYTGTRFHSTSSLLPIYRQYYFYSYFMTKYFSLKANQLQYPAPASRRIYIYGIFFVLLHYLKFNIHINWILLYLILPFQEELHSRKTFTRPFQHVLFLHHPHPPPLPLYFNLSVSHVRSLVLLFAFLHVDPVEGRVTETRTEMICRKQIENEEKIYIYQNQSEM